MKYKFKEPKKVVVFARVAVEDREKLKTMGDNLSDTIRDILTRAVRRTKVKR